MRRGIRLTLKVAGLLTLALTAVLITFAYLNVRRERALFEEMKELRGRIVGQAIAERLAASWDAHDVHAGELLHQDTERPSEHLTVDWFPLHREAAQESAYGLTVEQLEALERGQVVSLFHRQGGADLMHTYVPVPPPGFGTVVVEQSFTDRDFYVQAGLMRFFALLILIIAVNALLALAIGSWLVGRPVQKLIDKAARVAQGDFERPTGVRTRDELGSLAIALDDMSANLLEARIRLQNEEAARREAEAELRHAERLATIGKLAAGVAHELGTPLNVISGRAKRIARQRETDADVQGTMEIIRSQVDRMTAIIRQLLDFARRRRLNVADVDLRELIHSTVANLAPTLASNVEIEMHFDPQLDTRIKVDGQQVQQVLNNLVVNAAQAMPDGGQVALSLESRNACSRIAGSSGEAEYLCVVVEDHGVGISRDDLPRVFEPFFTTKDVGKGTGLGLAVSHGIVERHEGWIEVSSEPGRGSRFMVFLPRTKAT